MPHPTSAPTHRQNPPHSIVALACRVAAPSRRATLLAAAILLSTLTLPGTAVATIAAGGSHSCAIHDGAAKCWGYNNLGQLGDGTITDRWTPVAVSGLDSGVTAIAGGQHHNCAIHNGAAKCWGYNSYGQLGNDTNTNSSTPVAVNGLDSGVTTIAAGQDHSCAIHNGAAKCWGRGSSGRLGDGFTTNRKTPVAVSGLDSGVTAIAGGESHSCAIHDGAAKCWGYNGFSQLGDGTITTSSTPVAVSGLDSGVTTISAGSIHGCAIHNGTAKCWGYNGYGRLGDGTTTDRMTPVAVSGLTSGAICGDSSVDGAEQCDLGALNGTAGSCCSATCELVAAATECRPSAGACDLAETCDGASADCPSDQFVSDGTACGAAGPCTSSACQTGACEEVASPREDCRVVLEPLAAKFTLKDSTKDSKDQLGWDWKLGQATTVADLGGPTQVGGAAYELCVFDESGPEPELVLSAEVAPGAGWAAQGSKGYKFSDKLGTQGGITQILAKAGADGKASLQVDGKGAGLDLPTLPLGLPARVQLEVVGGVCFEATFSNAGTKKNDAGQFQGQSD